MSYPPVHEGIVLRFPCPVCREWVPFEKVLVPGHGYYSRCILCDHGFPHHKFTDAIASLQPAWRGSITYSYN